MIAYTLMRFAMLFIFAASACMSQVPSASTDTGTISPNFNSDTATVPLPISQPGDELATPASTQRSELNSSSTGTSPITTGTSSPATPTRVDDSTQTETPEDDLPLYCERPFLPVSTPLNDLGTAEYFRMETGPNSAGTVPTGFSGGLYPGGSNVPPAEHLAAGLQAASQITPRDQSGTPHPNGKIGLISIGMSNTAGEFNTFNQLARVDADVNPHLVLVPGASPGMVATEWISPTSHAWDIVDEVMLRQTIAPPQVQAAWVKLTNYELNDFPEAQYQLMADLETIMHNLKEKFPNLVIVYLSSRTRSYTYWEGLNPEPGAFETGFAVKWLIEKQINGDPGLNFTADKGAVVSPYLTWGPYLWADGSNPRSDGMVWLPVDMARDCTHPSLDGRAKIASFLMEFFKGDETSRPWFLVGVEPLLIQMFFPLVRGGIPEADPPTAFSGISAR